MDHLLLYAGFSPHATCSSQSKTALQVVPTLTGLGWWHVKHRSWTSWRGTAFSTMPGQPEWTVDPAYRGPVDSCSLNAGSSAHIGQSGTGPHMMSTPGLVLHAVHALDQVKWVLCVAHIWTNQGGNCRHWALDLACRVIPD